MTRRALILAVATLAVFAGAGRGAAPQRIVFAADHQPTVAGEVILGRVDVSRSLAADGNSFATADGARVAFTSARGGRAAVYVAAGGAVRRVSPPLFALAPNDTVGMSGAWDPAGRRFAATVWGPPSYDHPNLYLAGANGGWRLLARNASGMDVLGWSPDGTRLAYRTDPGSVRVLGFGVPSWVVAGVGAAWSPDGRLGVREDSSHVAVYDAGGRRLAGYPATALAWSQSGVLATLTGSGRVQLRPGGTGRPTLDARAVKGVAVQWLGATRLRIGTDAVQGPVGFDTRTGRTFRLPALYRSWDTVLSADGLTAAATVTKGWTVRLLLGHLSGAARTVATASVCPEETPFDLRQVVGGRVLYEAGCVQAPADLYSMAPDGSVVHRITTSRAHDVDPSISPDGRTVAYVQTGNAFHCHGCPYTLFVSPSAGGRARALTTPSDLWPYAFSPSWSPDGTRILYEEAGATDPSRLMTVSPQGGNPTDLNIVGSWPAWGPSRIAYNDDGHMKTARPDGSDVRPVLNGEADSAAWAPDGRLTWLKGSAHLELVLADGSSRSVLPVPTVRRAFPQGRIAWSPDGTRVAFAAYDRDGVSDVYVFTLASHRLTRLTHGLGAVGGVSWR